MQVPRLVGPQPLESTSLDYTSYFAFVIPYRIRFRHTGGSKWIPDSYSLRRLADQNQCQPTISGQGAALDAITSRKGKNRKEMTMSRWMLTAYYDRTCIAKAGDAPHACGGHSADSQLYQLLLIQRFRSKTVSHSLTGPYPKM